MTAPGWQAPGGVLWWARVGARVDVPNTPGVTSGMLAPSFPTASALVEAPTAVAGATAIAPVVQGITPPIPAAAGSAAMLAPSVTASSIISAPVTSAAVSALVPNVEAITPVEAPLVAASASMLLPQLRGTVAVEPPPITAIAKALSPSVVATTPVSVPTMTAVSHALLPNTFDSYAASGLLLTETPTVQFSAPSNSLVLVDLVLGDATAALTSYMYGTQEMTLLGSAVVSGHGAIYRFAVPSPPAGEQTVTITIDESTHSQCIAYAYLGFTTLGATTQSPTTGTTISQSTSCDPRDVIVQAFTGTTSSGSVNFSVSGGINRYDGSASLLGYFLADSYTSTTFNASSNHTCFGLSTVLKP